MDGVVEHADACLPAVLRLEELFHAHDARACDDAADGGLDEEHADLVARDSHGDLIEAEALGPVDAHEDALAAQARGGVLVRAEARHGARRLEAALVKELLRKRQCDAPLGALLHRLHAAVHALVVARELCVDKLALLAQAAQRMEHAFALGAAHEPPAVLALDVERDCVEHLLEAVVARDAPELLELQHVLECACLDLGKRRLGAAPRGLVRVGDGREKQLDERVRVALHAEQRQHELLCLGKQGARVRVRIAHVGVSVRELERDLGAASLDELGRSAHGRCAELCEQLCERVAVAAQRAGVCLQQLVHGVHFVGRDVDDGALCPGGFGVLVEAKVELGGGARFNEGRDAAVQPRACVEHVLV